MPVAADASASAPATDQSAEIDRLKSENQRLSDEISVTMDTMGRMLGEYTQLYSNQDGEGMVTMDAILAFARGEEQTDAGRVMATPVDPTDVDDDIEIEVTPTASDEDIANMLAEAGAGAAPEPVSRRPRFRMMPWMSLMTNLDAVEALLGDVAEQVAPEPQKEGVEKPKEDLQATGTDSNIE